MNTSSQRIRVMFGLNDLLVGGMQRQFTEQIRHYDRSQYDIVLVTLFDFPGRETMYAHVPPDVPVHRLHFFGIFDIISWMRLFLLLRSARPDIVVSSLFFANTVFRLLQPLIGYRVIPREHNTYVHKRKLHQYIDRLLAPLSFTIVAVSSAVADFTASQERIARSHFTVIRNGIDVPKVAAQLDALPSREVVRQELEFPANALIFLNVARLAPQKNHELLLSGFAIFLNAHPEAMLAIVGGGNLQHALEARARELGISASVRFFGTRRDVWRFYKASDVFVSTSDIEGLSNAYMEAMASGLPLVATKTAGTDELIQDGENGVFIQERSGEHVAYALEKVLSAGPRQLGEQARRSMDAFDIRETVKGYERLFDAALGL